MKTSHYHWVLSGVLLLLLGWQIRYLLNAPLRSTYQLSGNYGAADAPWHTQTDVIIALLAAALFIVMVFVKKPSAA